jgi:hypothetical protein
MCRLTLPDLGEVDVYDEDQRELKMLGGNFDIEEIGHKQARVGVFDLWLNHTFPKRF